MLDLFISILLIETRFLNTCSESAMKMPDFFLLYCFDETALFKNMIDIFIDQIVIMETKSCIKSC